MSQALFTVIGGALLNLSEVLYVEESTFDKGKVIVHFKGGSNVVLDGTMEVVLMKLGGGDKSNERVERVNGKPVPPHRG
jgi:hypothetical protein